MAHCIRKEARNMVFGNEIADLMANDESRRSSGILKGLNNFIPAKDRYDTKKQPAYAYAPGTGRLLSRFLRNKVPMKVSCV
jgi:hypothetical protein